MACDISGSFLERGKLALELLEIDEATENFSRAIIEENFNNPEYWSLLAESLFYQSKFDDSLECWKEVVSKDPLNKIAWIRISALYALQQDDELAIYYYKIAEDLPIEK
ncbi:MAG TPA: tetratricopeptide repeat protein [candidate division Zixibacteria bacterium]|nr:tetratricopeptide repeat protein [candidate division Zixibacteria bacterium]